MKITVISGFNYFLVCMYVCLALQKIYGLCCKKDIWFYLTKAIFSYIAYFFVIKHTISRMLYSIHYIGWTVKQERYNFQKYPEANIYLRQYDKRSKDDHCCCCSYSFFKYINASVLQFTSFCNLSDSVKSN